MGAYIRAFNRFELKYLLHHTQARELLEGIRAHVIFDENAGRDGFYKVASVYYDSPDLMCFWEKIDGEDVKKEIKQFELKAYVPSARKRGLRVQLSMTPGPGVGELPWRSK